MNHGLTRKIFVVGSSRSGSTMMGRIMGSHSVVFTFHELHFFEQLWAGGQKSDGASFHEREAVNLAAELLSIQRHGYLAKRCPERYLDEARKIIGIGEAYGSEPAEVFANFMAYESSLHGKQIACDQTPRNVFYLEEILGLYPDARVIAMVRDPRAVLLSQKGKWKRRFLGARRIPLLEAVRSYANYHPITITKLWVGAARSAMRYAEHPRVRVVRFEDLVHDPRAVVGQLCSFLGIEFEEAMLDVPQVGSSSETDQPERRGVNGARADAWRAGGLRPAEVYLCQLVARTEMTTAGYELDGLRPSLGVVTNILWFPLHLAAALAFNIKRMKNVMEAVKRRLT